MNHPFFLPVGTLTGLLGSLILIMGACEGNKPSATPDEGDLLNIAYNPTAYTIAKPAHFPQVPVPDSNAMTVEGVQLGRRLFYDPILSGDSTMSCASCHGTEGSFTDNKRFSIGIDGVAGRRNSMSLLNIAYTTTGLFWDGRTRTLEQQSLHPVEDPVEMHDTWPNVIGKLRRHADYPALFRKAFGVSDRDQINRYLVAKAIAQFERTLVSSGQSKYDRFRFGQEVDLFDEEEIDGMLMFFDEGAAAGLPDAQCFHCHGGITLTGGNFFNNGLDKVGSLADFPDKGRGAVTGQITDNGKFRAPTMRNIVFSAPYMHDGRFSTLHDVLDHYSKNGTGAANEDPFIRQIGPVIPGSNPVRHAGLTDYQKRAIIKFLHTLTDTTFMKRADIQNPFK
jgi:cytochrome c peroxidase